MNTGFSLQEEDRHQTTASLHYDDPTNVSLVSLLLLTGLGLKLRLLFALCCVAFLPTILLAFLVTGRTFTILAGRNAILVLLVLVVAIVLVATWAALPIIRPIRKATREIIHTTGSVTNLAQGAQDIATEHNTSTAILTGASLRLSARRQSIMRDCGLIFTGSQSIQRRVQELLNAFPPSSQKQEFEQALMQDIHHIATLARSMGESLAKDMTLERIDQAMKSAHEMTEHFQDASTHLQQEARQLELASQSLL
ncbi:hypothetical protein [Ktedonobacter racemifer]|uniref:Methyl-accepting chemotaxis sensory transducer n=1 Tax=Ktedonobacter racemifer DSM 44963 TaxID=485913 RepID=D6TQ61_KTERA|nr:hypothetical protein [Ktedonobacter racemifer]EFH85709.1 hypothetical protein Krac_6939 [Ktedonobacter racemifer DSM 44963]